jgi:hypothetical protein
MAELEAALAQARDQIDSLEHRIAILTREAQRLQLTRDWAAQLFRTAPVPSRPVTDTMLKELIAFAHPDKWPDNPLAHEITVRLNTMREQTR